MIDKDRGRKSEVRGQRSEIRSRKFKTNSVIRDKTNAGMIKTEVGGRKSEVVRTENIRLTFPVPNLLYRGDYVVRTQTPSYI